MMPSGLPASMPSILAPRLFDGAAWHESVGLTITDGVITALAPDRDGISGAVEHLPPGTILAPGFIDLQVNGGGGVLLNDDLSPAGVARIMAAHRAFGTTGMMPTLISDQREILMRLVAMAPEALRIPGILGFHLEGPFLNPARRGVHASGRLRRPEAEDFALIERLVALCPVMVTLAPEIVPEGTIARLAAMGVKVFIGHSDADAACIRRAADEGAVGVTHLFNAMSQLSARAPGVVGAALDDARLICGLICDGHHVDPITLRLAFRAAGRERLALVTDAMPSLGAEAEAFQLYGQRVRLVEGTLMTDDGTLAGAHLGMSHAGRNAVRMMGASLGDALVMASRTPARVLGMATMRGRIAPGFRADLVALTPDFEVIRTWIGGV